MDRRPPEPPREPPGDEGPEVRERERAQAALRRAHAENDRILQTLPAALVAVDALDRVLRWNDRAAALLRLPARAALGRPLLSLPLPLPEAPLRDGLRSARERGLPLRLPEVEYRHPDGSGGFLELTVNPVELEGAPALLLVGTDITEIKTLQESTARARRLESLGQLAAGVAHEINTPLQFLGDNARFLEKAVAELGEALDRTPGAAADGELAFLRKECPRALQHTREGLEIVSRIVRSLKHLSHPGSGSRTRVDLAAAVDDVLTLTRNEWKDVATVETRVDPELGPLTGYPGEIRQALLNVVVNAAHAVAERHAKTGETGRIAIEAARVEDRLVLRVRDSGTGIAEADRPRVFDPFFTTKPPGRGTGQGLAIVHDAIVEKHGGALRVESQPGRGTVFHLELPLEEEVPEEAEP